LSRVGGIGRTALQSAALGVFRFVAVSGLWLFLVSGFCVGVLFVAVSGLRLFLVCGCFWLCGCFWFVAVSEK
jgi:hypothetical protein